MQLLAIIIFIFIIIKQKLFVVHLSKFHKHFLENLEAQWIELIYLKSSSYGFRITS